MRLAGLTICLALLAAGCGGSDEAPAPRQPQPATATATTPERAPLTFSRIGATTAIEWSHGDLGAELLRPWRSTVPDVERVSIRSTVDGEAQRAMWLAPREAGPRPLLVVLHSWSSGYRQDIGIPFAQWAEEHGWAFIHPHFRGVNRRPEATGSDLAVRDVLDAVDWASEQADIDADRVFVIGFSGGGHMALLMAGRHADRFAGAVAWVPIYDLEQWYVHHRDNRPGTAYIPQIRASCGGDPTTVATARRACRHRSPSAHLDGAREAGIPLYIGHGLSDTTATPAQALRTFNAVARDSDRFGARTVAALDDNRLPEFLRGRLDAPTYFGRADPRPLLSRRSGQATLVIFDGVHDLVYNPGLAWMVATANAATRGGDGDGD